MLDRHSNLALQALCQLSEGALDVNLLLIPCRFPRPLCYLRNFPWMLAFQTMRYCRHRNRHRPKNTVAAVGLTRLAMAIGRKMVAVSISDPAQVPAL